MPLPGLSFTVDDPHGVSQRFLHLEHANAREESLEFCRQHWPDAEESACVESMLKEIQWAAEHLRAQGRVEL